MENPRSEALIDAYFAKLHAQMGRMPEAQRRELEQELRQHLAALVARRVELGLSPEGATAAALARFGDPVRIGRRLARESRSGWLCCLTPCELVRWMGSPVLIGINTAAWIFGGMLKTGGQIP